MHFWPKQLDKEILEIFPSLKMQDLTKLIVIPTWQPTKCDLAGIGPDIEEEKTRCLENMTIQNYWADYIDPTSGYPMNSTRGSFVFHDVDTISLILDYPTITMGMCTLISHPKWRTATYPATIFTNAPVNVVQDFFQSLTLSSEE